MSNELKGTIKHVLEIVKGTTKDGSEWQKLTFVLSNNDGYEGAEQIFAFEIFGVEKVDKFTQYNKVGDLVDVSFNIRTNEWKGKYFTALQAWKVFTASPQSTPTANDPLALTETSGDPIYDENGVLVNDLPF